jgi:NADPH-dependent ferric siderophore reductase
LANNTAAILPMSTWSARWSISNLPINKKGPSRVYTLRLCETNRLIVS